jgi:tetratricopeptide (TPR) repeat protein
MDQRYTAASDGEIIAKALHNLGAGFRRKKEPARAILAYQQALRIAPDRFKTLKDLTFAHWQLAAQWAERIDAENPAPQTELVARFRRQIDAAISTGQRALGLRPDADLYYQLGKIYQQLGQRQEALAAYRQTLAQNPDYARAYQRMAEIYTQQGDQDAAARALQTASTRPNANPPSPQPDR